jgi:hypothetical protein
MNASEQEISNIWDEFKLELDQLNTSIYKGINQLSTSSQHISESTIVLLQSMFEALRGVDTAAQVTVENLQQFMQVCALLDAEMQNAKKVEAWIKEMNEKCEKFEAKLKKEKKRRKREKENAK